MIGDGMRTRIGLVLGRDLTLGTLAERLAAIHGDRRLVEEADRGLKLTHEQAARRVDRWAGSIAAKISAGEPVVLATGNGYEQLLLSLAVARAGGLAVPVNSHMRPDEIKHVVADSGAQLVIASSSELGHGDPLAQSAPAKPDDVAALFYTSGTTGKPKGAQLTHRGLIGAMGAAAAWPGGFRRDEAVFGLPIAHIMGFSVALGMAVAGIPVYFLPRFNPVRALEAIEERRATTFCGVPAMYRMMLEAGAAEHDLTSVRVWLTGADAMPPDLAQQFKRFGASATLPLVGPVGEAAFAEGYGMVESAGGVAAKLSPPGLPMGLGDSVGFALPGYRFRVVGEDDRSVAPGQIGELHVRGPGLLKGYHGAPEATAAALTKDGWLRTGDLARKGSRGVVMFAGRQKDVIKHGGYSVYAVEVEQALEEHPDVSEASVIGLDDPRQGQVPAAVVRLRAGVDLQSLGLEAWAKERLSDYKVPRRFVAVTELPRTGTNKVQKDRLRELFDDPIDDGA